MYVLYTHDISYIMIGIYKHIHGYCKYISDASDLKARCLVFQNRPGSKMPALCMGESDTSCIDHLVMREFVSGPPRYNLVIKGICEQFVVLEQSSGL